MPQEPPVEQEAQGAPVDRPLYTYIVRVSDQVRESVSMLPPEFVAEHGLPRPAIAGIFTKPAAKRGQPPWDSFWVNPDFLQIVHEVVAALAPTMEALQSAARQQGDGWVYVLDDRSPDAAQVPIEDVVGGFAVAGGEIDTGSYRPNPEWALVGPRGRFRLPAPLTDHVMSRLTSLTFPVE